jgi:hypothetical protein
MILHEFIQKAIQEIHNGIHLMLGTLPIFCREGVDRYGLKTDLVTVGADLAKGLRTRLMAVLTGHSPLFRPTAVAVHDEGDVLEMLVELGGLGSGSLGVFIEKRHERSFLEVRGKSEE